MRPIGQEEVDQSLKDTPLGRHLDWMGSLLISFTIVGASSAKMFLKS
jgi:hypothetical protein